MLVICEFAHDCRSEGCSYRQATEGNCMDKAMCGHISGRVDIIEYNEVGIDNPNYKFKRKKQHGL